MDNEKKYKKELGKLGFKCIIWLVIWFVFWPVFGWAMIGDSGTSFTPILVCAMHAFFIGFPIIVFLSVRSRLKKQYNITKPKVSEKKMGGIIENDKLSTMAVLAVAIIIATIVIAIISISNR